jgi:hypothetical protein
VRLLGSVESVRHRTPESRDGRAGARLMTLPPRRLGRSRPAWCALAHVPAVGSPGPIAEVIPAAAACGPPVDVSRENGTTARAALGVAGAARLQGSCRTPHDRARRRSGRPRLAATGRARGGGRQRTSPGIGGYVPR